MKHVEYLGISLDDKESLDKFREIIMDKYQVKKHDNIIRLLKSEEYIASKMANLQMHGIDTKNLTNVFQKIQLVKVLEHKYGLDFLKEVGANSGDMDDDFYNLIKRTFRLRNAKPTTAEQINNLYASMFRSITDDKTLVRSGKRGLSTNKALFEHHLELNKIKNNRQTWFSESAIKAFNIEVEAVPDVSFAELDDDL